MRAFELELIPGLLQTEQYAREVHALRGQVASDDLERRVKARLRRQERLTASDPLHLSALISEAALTRCARQPSVAAEQFRQLLAWAQRPTIEIQVLPFETGLHSGMQGAFTLLSFPEGVLPDTGWQEYALGGHIIDGPSDVASLTKALRRAARSGPRSRREPDPARGVPRQRTLTSRKRHHHG